MTASRLVPRLERPLVAVIAVVLTASSVSAAAYEPDRTQLATTRAGATTGTGAAPGGGADGVGGDPATGGDATTDGASGSPEADGSPTASLGPSAVPTAGVRVYSVRTTTDGGEVREQREEREIVVLGGDRTTGTVQITARLEGESQISVLEWSPGGAFVRSTRIDGPSGPGEECTWTPPFAEFGPLAPGATWTQDSMCRTPVGGIDTAFHVAGSGRVVGTATAVVAGVERQVWQIERDRTTTIEAEVGGRTLTQQAREQGTLYLDPAEGIVVRSDVTVTLSGNQSGTTRRVSVLEAG